MLTQSEIETRLAAGQTPAGDDAEDGSGNALCHATDGPGAWYRYRRTETGYLVTEWGRLDPL